jgi:hypothetical protein
MSHRQHQVVNRTTSYIHTDREEHPLRQLFICLEQRVESTTRNGSSHGGGGKKPALTVTSPLIMAAGAVLKGQGAAGRGHLPYKELPRTLEPTCVE